MSRTFTITLTLACILGTLAGSCSGATSGALQVGFYQGKCNSIDVEVIVESVIRAWFSRDPTIVAALLRMHMTAMSMGVMHQSYWMERTQKKLLSLISSVRGFEIIDAGKAAVEAFSPGMVSCADIIAMATRDAVALSLGVRYTVQSGRRDGTVSLAENVNLPAPSISVSDSIKAFSKKGLDSTDMVYLLGKNPLIHLSFSSIKG